MNNRRESQSRIFPNVSLSKELGIILVIKTGLLFFLWSLFFNPQTKVAVDVNTMADVFISSPAVNAQ